MLKLYFHYCPGGFSNCYLLGTGFPNEDDEADDGAVTPREAAPLKETALPREAIIIDPGNMDSELLGVIEDNDFILRGILITHDQPHHVRGLNTILKIYNTDVYAINHMIMEHRTTLVHDRDIVEIGPFSVEVISIPGHSADSAIYKIERLLFTGDTLSAGLTGSVNSSYAAANQATALRSKLLSMPGDYTILPGHGPPTSLEAERRFNMSLNSYGTRNTRSLNSYNSLGEYFLNDIT